MAIAALVLLAQAALSEPPAVRTIDPYAGCVCAEDAKESDASFVGLVQDARVSLAPGGRSVLSRQQTIFQVISSDDDAIDAAANGGALRVWHETEPEACGVTFDYGRRYRISVRSADDGFETDYCLQPTLVD
ncbi:MAG: hypothetical protein AAF224_11695 [Pseudomonadota bacterium]